MLQNFHAITQIEPSSWHHSIFPQYHGQCTF